MMKEISRLRRLRVLAQHVHFAKCFYSTPTITVTPPTSLVDQIVDIVVTGLKPNQTVTLVAKTEENKNKFESRCVVTADQNGTIDNHRNPSVAGTFTGLQPMGLFWSITCSSGARLVKKDVSTPITYNLDVYNGSQTDADTDSLPSLATTSMFRYFKKSGVRRIPVNNGKFQGTIFVPEGEGPFPALVDMFGGIVTLIETRAALLASHGYATFALSYLYGKGLAQTLLSVDLDYICEATKWFRGQDYVDEKRFGAFGLCFGGTMCLYLAAMLPEIKVVVNINGISMHADKGFNPKNYGKDEQWPKMNRVYRTHEGVIINDVYTTERPVYIPAWQHGAKVLQISGEDDKQVHPKWHRLYEKQWPEKWKSNFKLVSYPGAGHLIEPPFMPLSRIAYPGRKRLSTIEFMPKEVYGEPMMAGGFPRPHAFAQEDSWQRILMFLDKNLKKVKV